MNEEIFDCVNSLAETLVKLDEETEQLFNDLEDYTGVNEVLNRIRKNYCKFFESLNSSIEDIKVEMDL